MKPPPPPEGLGTADAPFDFALVGAGAAGLSLAVQLSARFSEATAVLIDPGFGDVEDRTFAFWHEGEPPLADAVEATWARVAVATTRETVTRPLDAFRYHVISGAGFRDACFRRLRGDGRTFHRPGRVDAIDEAEHRVVVRREDGLEVHARWAFDSRPHEPDGDRDTHVALRQRFLGWEIEAEPGAFDPNTVTLFDFRVPQGEGDVRFVYVLPFSDRRALVEHVAMRDGDEKAALGGYARDVLGLRRYRIARVEAGDSPLTDAVFTRRTGPRTLRVGIAGGRLKASSGYAFTRIWEDARSIVRSLAREGHPFDLPADPERFRILDGLLLRVMRRRPEAMPEIFLRMFERNPADRVFRFLDERVGAGDIVALGTSLPSAPFVEAVGEKTAARVRAALRRLVAPIDYEG